MAQHFTPHTKMADLLLASYKNILIVNRLGIKLGFGEKSIAETCEQHHIEPSFLLLLTQLFNDESYTPTDEEISKIPVIQTINFLEKSHLHYLNVLLPQTREALSELTKECSEVHTKALNRFFLEYENEVKQHLEFEDKEVYPYVHTIIGGKSNPSFSIQQFEDSHENISVKLLDLRNIIIKYIPETENEFAKINLLSKLSVFEKELDRHTQIEDKVLVPGVIILEQKLQ